MKETKRNRRLGNDPLIGYFEYLLKNKELPIHATELLRVYREFNIDNEVTINKNIVDRNSKINILSKLKPKKSHIIKWTPQLAIRENHHEIISN